MVQPLAVRRRLRMIPPPLRRRGRSRWLRGPRRLARRIGQRPLSCPPMQVLLVAWQPDADVRGHGLVRAGDCRAFGNAREVRGTRSTRCRTRPDRRRRHRRLRAGDQVLRPARTRPPWRGRPLVRRHSAVAGCGSKWRRRPPGIRCSKASSHFSRVSLRRRHSHCRTMRCSCSMDEASPRSSRWPGCVIAPAGRSARGWARSPISGNRPSFACCSAPWPGWEVVIDQCPGLQSKSAPCKIHLSVGAVAQLGERCVRNAEVGSSTLLRSTKRKPSRNQALDYLPTVGSAACSFPKTR